MQNHTSTQYENELKHLLEGIARMGALADQQIGYVLDAMSQRYDGDYGVFLQTTEEKINQLERDLNQQCSLIIALRQPTAVDLRFVMSVVKTVNDLERIGDETKKIGATTVKLLASEYFTNTLILDLTPMLNKAREMVSRALAALVDRQVNMAATILDEDRIIDAGYSDILKKLITFQIDSPGQVAAAVDLALIAKAIERIGDHATNIAESLVRVVKGEDISHLSRESQALHLRNT